MKKIKIDNYKAILPANDLIAKKHYPLFVIEGVDGSGKSSLGPIVAKRINGNFHEYPMAFKPALNIIDEGASSSARFMFYMAYNMQTSEDISNFIFKNPVVCVRYIYSTIVYHIVKGVSEKMIFEVAEKVPLIRPERVFFLDVSDKKIQMERINQRGISNEDIRVLEQMELIRKTYLKLSDIMPNFTYIDTSYLSKEEVVSKIVKKII